MPNVMTFFTGGHVLQEVYVIWKDISYWRTCLTGGHVLQDISYGMTCFMDGWICFKGGHALLEHMLVAGTLLSALKKAFPCILANSAEL